MFLGFLGSARGRTLRFGFGVQCFLGSWVLHRAEHCDWVLEFNVSWVLGFCTGQNIAIGFWSSLFLGFLGSAPGRKSQLGFRFWSSYFFLGSAMSRTSQLGFGFESAMFLGFCNGQSVTFLWVDFWILLDGWN